MRFTPQAASPWPNTWQGEFPRQETFVRDGFGRAPLARSPPSRPTATALHDMIGNVWEWND